MIRTLEDAIILACNAHRGQVDKVGEPYVLHPLRVMFSFQPYQAKKRMVAVLHDVIEDTDITAQDLLEEGYDPEVVAAVVALSKTNPDMTYLEFIENKVCQNPLAVDVKIADINDNTSMERLLRLDKDTQERLLAKYEKALRILAKV